MGVQSVTGARQGPRYFKGPLRTKGTIKSSRSPVPVGNYRDSRLPLKTVPVATSFVDEFLSIYIEGKRTLRASGKLKCCRKGDESLPDEETRFRSL